MIKRKLTTLLTIAAMFYWTPSVIPVVHLNQQAHADCPAFNFTTWDTAYACIAHVAAPSNSIHPWPAIVLIGGVVSIMLNAAIVWNTECRELTLGEAFTAGALPGVGIAINQSRGAHSACRH